MNEKIVCDNCPCLNSDQEEGTSCNLGYDIYPESKQIGNGHIYDISNNCGLEQISYYEIEENNGITSKIKKTFLPKTLSSIEK